MSEYAYVLTAGGRVLHLVRTSNLPARDHNLRVPTLCGRIADRHVHPSDHREGGRTCDRCGRIAFHRDGPR